MSAQAKSRLYHFDGASVMEFWELLSQIVPNEIAALGFRNW